MADKLPCATCAFRDPTAMLTDADIPAKLARAYVSGVPFWCHKDCTSVGGRLIPPLDAAGKPDVAKLTPCAGFVRLAEASADVEAFDQAVRAARLRLLRRLIRRPPTNDSNITRLLREAPTVTAEDLAAALDMLAAGRRTA